MILEIIEFILRKKICRSCLATGLPTFEENCPYNMKNPNLQRDIINDGVNLVKEGYYKRNKEGEAVINGEIRKRGKGCKISTIWINQ